MEISPLDQLLDLSQEDRTLLKTLSRMGAATAEEVALKLSRPGEDLTSSMEELVRRRLVETQMMTVGDEAFQIYQVDPLVRRTLRTMTEA